MRTWTLGEAWDVIKGEFDLTNESFIGNDEMTSFFNQALQKASYHIRKLGVEDAYFEDSAYLALVNGTSQYSMPSDIAGHKIRKIIYANGAEIYEVKKLRRKNKHFNRAIISQYGSGDRYKYDIINPSSSGAKIELFPPSRETSSTVMRVFFIRETEYLTLPSAGSLGASRALNLDLPDCIDFLLAYVRYRVAQKIPHPELGQYKADHDEELRLMIDNLTGQVDDDETEIVPDLSHYQESS